MEKWPVENRQKKGFFTFLTQETNCEQTCLPTQVIYYLLHQTHTKQIRNPIYAIMQMFFLNVMALSTYASQANSRIFVVNTRGSKDFSGIADITDYREPNVFVASNGNFSNSGILAENDLFVIK